MTRAVPFTQASMRRAIAAARKEGLRVTGIRPDGTLVVSDADNAGVAVANLVQEGQSAASAKWEDVEA